MRKSLFASRDMGPLEFDREYKRVFTNGGGAISDSGSFIHKIDDVERALRIHNSTCRVPAPESQKADTESKGQQELEEERERLALEKEQESWRKSKGSPTRGESRDSKGNKIGMWPTWFDGRLPAWFGGWFGESGLCGF